MQLYEYMLHIEGGQVWNRATCGQDPSAGGKR